MFVPCSNTRTTCPPFEIRTRVKDSFSGASLILPVFRQSYWQGPSGPRVSTCKPSFWTVPKHHGSSTAAPPPPPNDNCGYLPNACSVTFRTSGEPLRLLRRQIPSPDQNRRLSFRRRGLEHHRWWTYATASALPFSTILSILPVPNLVQFYNLFRAHANWHAWKVRCLPLYKTPICWG